MKMKMMTYSEYIAKFDTGLFVEMNTIEPFEWNEVYEPEMLDILFLFHHGNKPIIPTIATIEISTLAKMILTAYNGNWKRLYEAFSKEYDIGETYRIENENTYTSDIENETIRNNMRYESAYNNDEQVLSDSDDGSVLDKNKKTDIRTNVNARYDFNTIQKHIDIMESKLLTDVVCKQVSNMITIKVYS